MGQNKNQSNGGGTGLEELREEVSDFLHGLSQGWVEKAGDKVSDLTDRLTDMAEDRGGTVAAGARMLHGENPAKAMVGQKAKDTKDKVVGKAKEAIPGMGGGDGDAGDSKATNIIETIDVGVPVRVAYNHWTMFEDFSTFTKGVSSVSKDDEDETASEWNMKIAFSSRTWKATVEEQIPDERIKWSSEGNKGTTTGVISFHELAPDLTRIIVVVEYRPDGFVEKTANLWRAAGRRLRLDLKHFGRHVTMNAEDEIEGWRGEIRDGEVVRSHEEGLEDDRQDEDAYDDAEDSEDEDEGAQDEGAQDEPDDAQDEDEEEDEEGEDQEAGGRRARASRGHAR